jgi:hypothetical protein
MRETIVERLASVPHERFLVYLMGPYKAFEPADLVDDPADLPDFLAWDDAAGEYDQDEVVDLLRRLQGDLRTGPGVNAFLAVDVAIDLDEMNAVRQTIEFARASNAVVFVIPMVGKNVGVGIEVGSVLQEDEPETERILFVHEQGVRSSMIRGIGEEWDVDVQSYVDEADLARKIRLFVMEIMERETRSAYDLEPKDQEF